MPRGLLASLRKLPSETGTTRSSQPSSGISPRRLITSEPQLSCSVAMVYQLVTAMSRIDLSSHYGNSWSRVELPVIRYEGTNGQSSCQGQQELH